MDSDEIASIQTEVKTGNDVSIIDIYGNPLNPLLIADLDVDDMPQQRGITKDGQLIHIVDTIVAGRDTSYCTWAFKVLSEKEGLFDFSIKINNAISDELKKRREAKQSYKRWKNNMNYLILQLFVWDFEFLDEALEDVDLFINEHVHNQANSVKDDE